MYCPYCGTESAVQAGFCQSCGANLSQVEALPKDQANQCPDCSTVFDPQAKFCLSCGTKLPERAGNIMQVQIPLPAPQSVDYAGFWRRFAAFIIDMIALKLVGMVIGIFSVGPALSPSAFMGRFDMGEFLSAFLGISTFLTVIIGWLYFTLLESSSKQATLGKMALGLVVTDMNGNRISFLRATGRHFGKIISGMIFMIGYIMAGVTSRKQALHDMIAGCLVLVRR